MPGTDLETQRRLTAINRELYRVTAVAFDATRQRAWQGWGADAEIA